METSSDIFATTRWTVIVAAGAQNTPESNRALEELCHTYWYPLYAYCRRRGWTREDAEDLTQGFLVQLLSRNYLDTLTQERGRFRAFLLAALKHFLANEWDRKNAQKRGGGAVHLSLDWYSADTQYSSASMDLSPDKAYDREWGLALLERVMIRLREECAADGEEQTFNALRGCITAADVDQDHGEIGRHLGLSAGATRVAIHRFRKRYRALLRNEIAQTLTSPEHAEDELRTLSQAFR